jgi:hypothetical protein
MGYFVTRLAYPDRYTILKSSLLSKVSTTGMPTRLNIAAASPSWMSTSTECGRRDGEAVPAESLSPQKCHAFVIILPPVL